MVSLRMVIGEARRSARSDESVDHRPARCGIRGSRACGAVHQPVDTGAGHVGHLGQQIPRDPRHRVPRRLLLVGAREQEERTRKARFAAVKNVGDEVLFEADVPGQQLGPDQSERERSAWSRCRISAVFTTAMVVPVTASAVDRRHRCPASAPSPKSAPAPRTATTVLRPSGAATDNRTRPRSMYMTVADRSPWTKIVSAGSNRTLVLATLPI